MRKQVFPKEFIRNSLENYTFKISKSSRAIYLVLLLSLIALFASLPFVSVDLSSAATGIVDTESSRFEILSSVSGRLEHVDLSENQNVHKGDTLLRWVTVPIREEINRVSERIEQIDLFMLDLKMLGSDLEKATPSTARYQVERLQFGTRLEQLRYESNTLKVVFDRQSKLYEQRVIAEVEFQKDEANYQKSLSEIDLFVKQSITRWEESVIQFAEESRQQQLAKQKLQSQLENYVLTAPATGELQSVGALSIGQFITAGQKLAMLTPDTTLVAVCWVAPDKIGLLKEGMSGIFRIDAFNYNDWGMINGTIKEISTDAYLVNGQPVFKVVCELQRDYLTLKNGFVGKLKKGMSMQANFRVASRTLYQLLYDKVDNWLNPRIS